MFIVMEIQTSEQVATIVNAYDDRNQAENKYHAILSAAAVSAVPKHGAVQSVIFMNQNQNQMKSKEHDLWI